jgi:hypothetical protein
VAVAILFKLSLRLELLFWGIFFDWSLIMHCMPQAPFLGTGSDAYFFGLD